MFCRHSASFKIGISKFQDFDNFRLSPMWMYVCYFSDLADLANSYKNVLSADKDAQYDQVINLDLSTVSQISNHTTVKPV